MLDGMHTDANPELSDRQARAVILAAEARGFEREPDLYPAMYDHDLHDDAQFAVTFLQALDPSGLAAALSADEPIPAPCAAWRITESGRFSLADADVVLDAAAAVGFTPPAPELPLLPMSLRWDQARAAVAYLWEHHPDRLREGVGETARIAPLPETARIACSGEWYRCSGRIDDCRRCGPRDISLYGAKR